MTEADSGRLYQSVSQASARDDHDRQQRHEQELRRQRDEVESQIENDAVE
jgi:hypothetical protein